MNKEIRMTNDGLNPKRELPAHFGRSATAGAILASKPVRANRRWTLFVPIGSLIACCAALAGAAPSRSVSFRNEVMAVFSKAGCSAGTCHGNKNGKGDFKLSLRGQDPEIDFTTLTRDLFARRVNSLEPDESLVLLKPTTQVAHEGGLRFKKGS